MSVEMTVFLRSEKLPTLERWSQALREAGFELVLDPSGDPRTQTGFWPATYQGKPAGFEYYRDDLEDVEIDADIAKEIGDRDTSVSFVTHSDVRELASSVIAAYVLCAISDGVFFDTEGNAFHTAAEALEQARGFAQDIQPELK